MSLTPERRQQLLSATREAAAAFIEDMAHIRDVLKRTDPDRQQLRNLSGILRRLLIDKGGDLPDIAAPRIGRLTILSPDNGPLYKSARKTPFTFFESGGVSAFGVTFSTAMVDQGSHPRNLEGLDPGRTIALPMDNFLSQKVLCLQGKWATRRDGIKYMANVASGIHSGRRKTDVEHLLNRIRHAANYAAVPLPAGIGAPGEMAASFQFNAQALNDDADLPFSYDPKNIDPVLVEMLATGHFLAISPDILTLETNVTKELRG